MEQRQIWIAAAVAFTLLLGSGVGGTVLRDYLSTRESVIRTARTHADLLAAHAEQGFANAVVALDRAAAILSGIGGRDDARVPELRVRFDDIVAGNPMVGTLWTTDLSGITWLNNNRPEPPLTDVRDRPYFDGALAARGELFVGSIEIGTVVPRPRFTLARTYAAADGRDLGIVVAGINQAYLAEVFARIPSGSEALLAAVNPRGDVLLAHPADEGAIAARVHAAATEGERAVGFDRVDGDLAVSGRWLRSADILLIAGASFEEQSAAWRERSAALIVAALAISASFAALTLVGIRGTRREEAARAALVSANEGLEERVAERTRTVELLFRELNHRVKNNLQIIASLLRLQIRKTHDPAVRAILQDSVNRVFAIADVHGEMENARGGAVGLKGYVGKIAERICEAMQKPDQTIDVELDVDDAELALDRAVMLAIAINEATTNAFKHAFSQRQSGRLAISVRISGERLRLTVRNDGEAPTLDQSAGTGLGSSIIGMLVQQMSGTMAIERDGGYAVTIEVPLH